MLKLKIKKLYITIIACLMGVSAMYAQNKAYVEQIAKTLLILDTAKTAMGFTKAADSFGKIAQTEKNEWLPFYYAGLCNVLTAFEKKGKDIDTYCDKADRLLAKADSLSKNNSEIYVLKSMVASARINVNVLGRGQKYGGQASALAEKAIQLNGDNPRAYLQKASAIYYTPELFGGGAKKAKPVFETALEKFNLFKPVSKIAPDWGKDRVQKLLKDINKNNTGK